MMAGVRQPRCANVTVTASVTSSVAWAGSQRDHRASEAASGHPGSGGASSQSCPHGGVGFRPGHLEVVAQRLVRFRRRPAGLTKPPGPQQPDGFQHPGVLADDVPGSTPEHRISDGQAEAGIGDVAQRRDPQGPRRLLTSAPSCSVAAIGQLMAYPGVDDQQLKPGTRRVERHR